MTRTSHHEHEHIEEPAYYQLDHCPGRPQVGYGITSEKAYFDFGDIPMPSVRFKREDEPGIQSLRKKELGDWKNLTIADKKELYRASFCQTFAEFEISDGEWKSIIGWVFFWVGTGTWFWLLLYWLINRGHKRPSLYLEPRQRQLERLIAMKHNPIRGISSQWDYEKEDWKKNTQKSK